jgi:alanyl-tRNA synthetase
MGDSTQTERLYYTDCYLREFEATVVDCVPDGERVRVYLDRTAFYPDSGGQPSDAGTLAGLPLLEVVDEGERVAHVLVRRPASDKVQGQIDWARRFDHMQQHTGQHILSAAFERTGGYRTVSFHLGAQNSTIDLDSDRLGRRQAEEAEDLANQIVFENREVRILFKPAAEASMMGLRKASDREGELRLVEIPAFDLSACGGTHVHSTGAVGAILVRKMERMKGSTRIEFVCGSRTIRTAREDFSILTEASRPFSGAAQDLPALIRKQAEELKSAWRAQEKLIKRLAGFEAKELWTATPEIGGRRIIRRVLAAEEAEEARALAHALACQPATIALIGVASQPAMLFFAQSQGGPADMGVLLRETLGKVGGKGGGAREFAQGGGFDPSALERVFAEATRLLNLQSGIPL